MSAVILSLDFISYFKSTQMVGVSELRAAQGLQAVFVAFSCHDGGFADDSAVQCFSSTCRVAVDQKQGELSRSTKA